MKKIVIKISVLAVWGIGMLVASSIPTETFASTARPTCALLATIDGVTTKLSTGATIFVRPDAAFGLAWEGRRATQMRDQNAHTLPVNGQATTSVHSYARFSYRFTGGSAATTCSVTVKTASGSVTSPAVASSSRPVTLKGTSRGVTSIVVSLIPVGVTTTPTSTINSPRITTRRTTWSYTLPKVLQDGNYQVEVATINGSVRTVIATSTLAIGNVPPPASVGATTVVVVPVPLLIGGRAHPNTPVGVAYLQLINIGYATATVSGITFTQYGNAPVAAIVGLTSVTDNGGARGSVGTMTTGTPFVGNTVTVPVGIVLAPREMRLVTIKANTSLNIAPYLGTTLTLWVTGVNTNAKLSSKLPLYGTTWTFGY